MVLHVFKHILLFTKPTELFFVPLCLSLKALQQRRLCTRCLWYISVSLGLLYTAWLPYIYSDILSLFCFTNTSKKVIKLKVIQGIHLFSFWLQTQHHSQYLLVIYKIKTTEPRREPRIGNPNKSYSSGAGRNTLSDGALNYTLLHWSVTHWPGLTSIWSVVMLQTPKRRTLWTL